LTIERALVLLYLAACIGIGIFASRKVLASRDEYWVAGRRIGTAVNAMAIMASLASGGSIIGVMGLAYSQGIPATLALFAGAVIGFPLASILVARQLRRFGRYTITDFLAFRFPNPIVRLLVPVLIVIAFTIYIVAQLKAAGITAQALLGIPYDTALVVATLVFITYVSIGGMIAITWTDVIQGVMMLVVVLGTALAVVWRAGSPFELMRHTTEVAPDLGRLAGQDIESALGYFVIWATAIPVIPHIVMRVFTARDGRSAQLSLNFAMLAYSVMILAAVLAIVPVGKLGFPGLEDADRVFLEVIQSEFPALIRGIAVAAVLAAVRVASAWVIGMLALYWALSPPELLSPFYTAGIGLLSAGLFVPTIAGLWWKKANLIGGVAALVAGTGTYALALAGVLDLGLPAIVVALVASALAMLAGGWFGRPDADEMGEQIAALHENGSAGER
jgi:sodium/pantothenate symporter